MSRLSQVLAARKAARKAATTKEVTNNHSVPKEIVDPTPAAFKGEQPAEVPAVEAKPTAFSLKPSAKLSGLTQISTTISESLSASEKKLAEQQEKGVYTLPEKANELMGSDAEHLVATMQALDVALVDKTPEIRTLSSAIRKNLEQYPELTHILSDDQLHIMVQGYLTIANVKTAPKTAAAKSRSAGKKADNILTTAKSKSVQDLLNSF